MYLKRYTIASFILIILVGWFVYVAAPDVTVSLSFMGINLPSISIAIVVVVPLALLYLASLFHMAFYSFLGGFKLKKYEKDYAKLIDALCDAFLQKESQAYEYKTPRYKLLGRVVSNSKIFPNASALLDIENEKLRKIVELIHKVQMGEVVDLKKLHLPPHNALSMQNSKNRYKKGELKAEEILINAKNHDENFVKEVFLDFVQSVDDASKIMKYYDSYLTKEALFVILNRLREEEGFALSKDDIITLVEAMKLSEDEYLEVAKILSKALLPEDRLAIFEALSQKDEKATKAYLYTAFDLEMMDLAEEILEASSPDEFSNFRAYKALKECGKNYNIDLFV